jgi:hypothetical protein
MFHVDRFLANGSPALHTMNFDLNLHPETGGDWLDQETYFLWAKKPLLVKLKTAM